MSGKLYVYNMSFIYLCLFIEQVELHWVPRVNVCVAVEVFPLEEEDVGLIDALLAEGLAVVDPVHWRGKRRVNIS